MGLDELKPGNTKCAKDTAISAFKAFFKSEDVELEHLKQCIEDATGQATSPEYTSAKVRCGCSSPVQRRIVEAKLLSIGKTLDSFCMK
ncbi:hypothetical protein PHMEG_00027592 [Phytophthora megakarya]|uniref:Uncharacterized protein n=1 Tax=Phytophthora megakarya TaxID=4795 RepID=A0A225V6X4_9STRA|nr:hypothetical protein PHMEG_00027592 [Phytophthora megakarya]